MRKNGEHDCSGNGKLASVEASCPFYEIGTADFHAFREDLVSQLDRLNSNLERTTATLIEQVCARKMVPMSSHLLTIGALIAAFMGTTAFVEIFGKLPLIMP